MIFKKTSFKKAKPIFAKGRCLEKNLTLLLKTNLPSESSTVMKMSGHCSYKVYINGEFVFFGPARAGRGYFRADELDISKYLNKESNNIDVLLTNNNCYSYYQLSGEGFFICEFINGNNVENPTGTDAWKTYIYDERYIKSVRQCFQRPFSEAYDMTKREDHLSSSNRDEVETEEIFGKVFIERELSLPDYPYESATRFLSIGKVNKIKPEKYFHDRAYDAVKTPTIDGYRLEELEIIPTHIAEECQLMPSENDHPPSFPIEIGADSYLKTALRGERTGFLKTDLYCISDCELLITYDEILNEQGEIDFKRMGCCNVVYYKLKGGQSYSLITAEPYSYQYFNIISLNGAVTLKGFGVIRADFNASEITKTLNESKTDDEIKRIFDAAIETFRQNTFDIYMDCPSRERAGWLCDSFFTSRVERLLTGKSTVEKCFLSNFIMDEKPLFIPEGMFPMCYPADHPDGRYIPNWAMWYVIELNEYLMRTGDREFVSEVKERIYSLLKFFKGFENEDGLLSRLESWVFVEWSKSNQLVQDINYPTNMLYYMFKKTLYKLYGDESLSKEADELRIKIRSMSRDGLFFCDNSVYNEDNVPVLSHECTESCQYYAFFTGVATPTEDKELWETLVNDFGPDRKNNNKWEKIYFSNAFIGNYLRCELLMREGEKDKLDENIRGYFDYMAKKTGTLWENDTPWASCNHGFASHVLVWLDYLGYLN